MIVRIWFSPFFHLSLIVMFVLKNKKILCIEFARKEEKKKIPENQRKKEITNLDCFFYFSRSDVKQDPVLDFAQTSILDFDWISHLNAVQTKLTSQKNTHSGFLIPMLY